MKTLKESHLELWTKHQWEELEKRKFISAVEASFNKKLTPDYMKITNPKYLSFIGNYLGGIVVEEIVNGFDYLDKFFVVPVFQGNGLGEKLWMHLNKMSKKVSWRAKKNNPMTPFYVKHSQGHLPVHGTDYEIFWYGFDSPCDIQNAYDFVRLKKPSFIEDRLKP